MQCNPEVRLVTINKILTLFKQNRGLIILNLLPIFVSFPNKTFKADAS